MRVEEDALDEEDQDVAEHDERVGEGVLAAVLVLLANLDDVGEDVDEAGGEEDATGEGVHQRDDAGHLGERPDDGQREQAADERLEEDDEEQANLEVEVRGAVLVLGAVVIVIVAGVIVAGVLVLLLGVAIRPGERHGEVRERDGGEQCQDLGPGATARENVGGGHVSVLACV